ncbi:MAG: NAD-dependent protein deacetylase, SIR2 family [Deltaproteobacteria bacterium]|nr:NAD-dependent protein deacetylase, SIR2 family [Deltaproteobacteria bacterium]
MSTTDDSLLADMGALCSAIDEADAILIGAGAGLSAAAGLLYMDFTTFGNWLPEYHEKYGLRYIYEAAFFDFPSIEEYYAYWARHISTIRFRHPVGKPYLDLYSIVKDRSYFVLTTSVDGQFIKAGFNPNRICTPQGDYGYFQCSRPCSNDLYPNQEIVESLLASMTSGSFAIRSEDIPRCPHCASLLEPNIRKGSNFVESPWMEKYPDLNKFLERSGSGKLLLLEFGVGFNTPSIVRYPFERIAATHGDSLLIRVNRDDAGATLIKRSARVKTYAGDAGLFLATFAATMAVNQNPKRSYPSA